MEKKQQESKHFHHKEKGCDIFVEYTDRKRFVKRAYCNTHRKEICYCGWDWGWHYGVKTIIKDSKVFVKYNTMKLVEEIVKDSHYTARDIMGLHIKKIKKATKGVLRVDKTSS